MRFYYGTGNILCHLFVTGLHLWYYYNSDRTSSGSSGSIIRYQLIAGEKEGRLKWNKISSWRLSCSWAY